MSNLLQARLKELLHYNPLTGVFTWVANPSKHSLRIGMVAGHTVGLGYVVIGIDTKEYYAHRLAFLYMEGDFPPKQVDHRDQNKANNIWANLRKATALQNGSNVGVKKNNKSGVPGVFWNASRNKWYAGIMINYTQSRLGSYADFFEACCARKSAENKYNFNKLEADNEK